MKKIEVKIYETRQGVKIKLKFDNENIVVKQCFASMADAAYSLFLFLDERAK